MAEKAKEQQNQINIELSEEIAEGEFANLAMIAHSSSEFVIDFIRLMPGIPKAGSAAPPGRERRQEGRARSPANPSHSR